MNIKDLSPVPESVHWLLWTHGGHPEFFVTHAAMIATFINQNKLTAVEQTHLAMLLPAGAKAPNATTIPQPTGFPGGMSIAHLHFSGNVYLLTQPQWNSFCGQIIQTYRDRLSKANGVSFDHLLTFAEAAEHMM